MTRRSTGLDYFSFGGTAGGAICISAAMRYDEERLAATELLFDRELFLGNHGQVTGELAEMTMYHPLRERFCEQYMLALYRCGRQTDALRVYRQLRFRLVNELGIEPSQALRDRERAILGHDPVLHVYG